MPKELCERSTAALCDFIGVDPNDPTTWRNYVTHGHGIIPLHHHQALWDVRQLPQLHELFSAIYQTPKLWVTFDRGSFKVPSSYHESGFRMDAVHWDGDPRATEDLAVQGLVYLTDTPAEQGAFAMVPESVSHARPVAGHRAHRRRSAQTGCIGLSAGAGRRSAGQRRDVAPQDAAHQPRQQFRPSRDWCST